MAITEIKEIIEAVPAAEVQHGGVEIVDRLAGEWRELCHELPDDQPFFQPEWVAAYVRNREPKRKLAVVTVRSGGKLKAVLPLVKEWKLFLSALPARTLRGATQLHTWRFDLVRAPGVDREAIVKAVWKSLRSMWGWDVIELPDVPKGGATEELLDAAGRDGYPTGSSEYMFTPVYRLGKPPVNPNSAFLPRSANLRRSLRRILRKVATQGNMKLERYDKAAPELLQRFYDLERAGWKGQRGTAIASDSATRNFFDELARVSGENGYLSLYFLKLDGRDVAGHFGLRFGGTYYMVKCAYDEMYGPYAPGHLLVHEVLRDCAERGLTTFDFMAHGEDWKVKWTSEWRPHSYCYIFSRSFYGRFLYAAKFRMNPVVKQAVKSVSSVYEAGTMKRHRAEKRGQELAVEIATEQGTRTAVLQLERGGVELIDRLADQWRALCQEGPSDQPFYRPEWIGSYVRAFACEAELLLITARVNGQLKAVLPLVKRWTYFSGLPARMLRSASNTHSCRFDLIRGAGQEGDAATLAVWSYLRESRDWDVLELRDVPEGGSAEALVRAAERDGFPTGQFLSLHSPFITLAGRSGDEWWLQQTDAKFRGNLRRRMHKLAAGGALTLRRIETADPEALQSFYDLELRGWKGKEGSAITNDLNTLRFYDLAASAAARFGYFSLYLLEWNGSLLAAHYGLTYGGVYYVPKLTYGEQFQQFAPGHVMIHEVVGDCVRGGLREFDFLGGSASWKKEWTRESRTLSYWYIFRPGPLGRALHAAKFKLKPALKAVLGKR